MILSMTVRGLNIDMCGFFHRAEQSTTLIGRLPTQRWLSATARMTHNFSSEEKKKWCEKKWWKRRRQIERKEMDETISGIIFAGALLIKFLLKGKRGWRNRSVKTFFLIHFINFSTEYCRSLVLKVKKQVLKTDSTRNNHQHIVGDR